MDCRQFSLSYSVTRLYDFWKLMVTNIPAWKVPKIFVVFLGYFENHHF